MRKKTLLLIICFTAVHSYSQNIRFYKENIDFEIKGQYFIVKGFYYFCNIGKDTTRNIISYPFPTGSDYGKVDSVKVFNVSDKLNIKNRIEKTGLSFSLKLGPYATKLFQIVYRQKLAGRKAEYILLTTKQWGRAFEQINYKLTVPDNIKVDSLSYRPDSSYTENNKQLFVWHKKNFMPNKNMIIYFQKK